METTAKFKELLGGKKYFELCLKEAKEKRETNEKVYFLIEITCEEALHYIDDSMKMIEAAHGSETVEIIDELYVQKMPLTEVAEKHSYTRNGIQKRVARALDNLPEFEEHRTADLHERLFASSFATGGTANAFRTELRLYTTYIELLRSIDDRIAELYTYFEPSSPRIDEVRATCCKKTLEQRYIEYLVMEKSELEIKKKNLIEQIGQIESALFRIPSTIRILVIKYYMLNEKYDSIAKEVRLQPRVVQRKILEYASDVQIS